MIAQSERQPPWSVRDRDFNPLAVFQGVIHQISQAPLQRQWPKPHRLAGRTHNAHLMAGILGIFLQRLQQGVQIQRRDGFAVPAAAQEIQRRLRHPLHVVKIRLKFLA